MRVLVCGGRDLTDQGLVWGELDRIHAETPITALLQGGAPGADRLAKRWARQHPEIQRFESKAEWTRYGNAAGMIRNAHMLTWRPDCVLAFPGGAGTADMVRKVERAGVPVRRVPIQSSNPLRDSGSPPP